LKSVISWHRGRKLSLAVGRLAAGARLLLALLLTGVHARAAGLYQDGAGGRAQAMGGSGTAVADDPLSALFDNPAALGGLDRVTVQGALEGAWAQGSFHNSANNDARLSQWGEIGAFAASAPLGPVTLAMGINPDISLRDSWILRDAPGGADGGTSYGVQKNTSEIALLRSALGVGWQVTPAFSLGANVGLLYNKNVLTTPYVFQTQRVLKTAKTLLNLGTEGLGWNGEAGLRWRVAPALNLSLAYTSRSRVDSHGLATGDAGVQFARLGLGAARSAFGYDARVANVFPQQLSAGAAWQARHGLTLSAQVDWIDWSDAFDTLGVHLTHGTDKALNSLVGSSALNDNIPLHWRDQFVERLGAEQILDAHWTVRAGYAYGDDPIPAGTLTPLNAAITEHTLTVGVGYRAGRVTVDAAYQWELPATGRVGHSELAAGEYSNSVTQVNVQWLNLTVKYGF
jgi:long-chain fatty acid transport protein